MVECTEIVFLVLRDGLNPEEKGSRAAEIVKKAGATLAEQKGFLRSYWGLRVEDPKSFVLTIDWTDVQEHKDFINSEAYKPFVALLAELFDFNIAPPFFYHVNFTSDSVPAREAPVTEFATFGISASSSQADKSKLEDNTLRLAQFVNANDKSKGSAIGWTIEEIEGPKGATNPLQVLIGWDSVEDHMKARENPEFGPLIGPIRESILPPKDGVQGLAVFHSKLHGKDFL
ncbi:uncharacterized protein HMPREF1541_05903 [Cyphellophora europaea CBS 101466]|uniref:ABM domain-containing protein n=1 Tax=Cyphellophora europaea (strain CBS 101466) TaxID=1220924 RepID=W2RT91_CYPE1|nr:uncharacterized protein HMPREF1541_05903 [Cyphellophora europaea CBS 101466]ETN39677.1 hypothetical protein HMPREF1541_05903 [Cyphellophora europaea CBS 101466]